jgi:hypothetical protein
MIEGLPVLTGIEMAPAAFANLPPDALTARGEEQTKEERFVIVVDNVRQSFPSFLVTEEQTQPEPTTEHGESQNLELTMETKPDPFEKAKMYRKLTMDVMMQRTLRDKNRKELGLDPVRKEVQIPSTCPDNADIDHEIGKLQRTLKSLRAEIEMLLALPLFD